jgi:hypothetical protein
MIRIRIVSYCSFDTDRPATQSSQTPNMGDQHHIEVSSNQGWPKGFFECGFNCFFLEKPHFVLGPRFLFCICFEFWFLFLRTCQQFKFVIAGCRRTAKFAS